MDYSEESLSSMISLPDFSAPEMNAIPLPCWQVPRLSDIWVPSHLLTSRKEPINTWETQGAFRTLEKRGHARKIESFSVYSDSDTDSEKDALQSDSDEACNLDCSEKIKTIDNSPKILDNFSRLQPFSVKSDISLNEILNSTKEVDINNFEFEKPLHSKFTSKDVDVRNFEFEKPYKHSELENKEADVRNFEFEKPYKHSELENKEVDVRNFEFEKPYKHSELENKEVDVRNLEFEDPYKHSELADKKVDVRNFEYEKHYKILEPAGKEVEIQATKKIKNAKKKSKAVRSVTLDRFLEDYSEADLQEACANSYLERIRRSQNKDFDEDPIQLRNNYEFPDLTPKKEIEFIKNEKTALDMPSVTMKGIAETLSQSDKNKNVYIDQAEEEIPTSKTIVGKFVVENIPSEVPHEEIFSFLSDYGEVKDFSLEPHGNFQRAFIEINSECGDIDWIIECLHDTEPFGGSGKINCYKQ